VFRPEADRLSHQVLCLVYNVYPAMSGWRGSILLLVMYVLAEWGCHLLGGDTGALLYVTSHFIVMPLAALCVGVLSIIRVARMPGFKRKVLELSSLSIPAAIILIAVSGHPGLSRYLGAF
jgi:hypothetical protein